MLANRVRRRSARSPHDALPAEDWQPGHRREPMAGTCCRITVTRRSLLLLGRLTILMGIPARLPTCPRRPLSMSFRLSSRDPPLPCQLGPRKYRVLPRYYTDKVSKGISVFGLRTNLLRTGRCRGRRWPANPARRFSRFIPNKQFGYAVTKRRRPSSALPSRAKPGNLPFSTSSHRRGMRVPIPWSLIPYGKNFLLPTMTGGSCFASHRSGRQTWNTASRFTQTWEKKDGHLHHVDKANKLRSARLGRMDQGFYASSMPARGPDPAMGPFDRPRSRRSAAFAWHPDYKKLHPTANPIDDSFAFGAITTLEKKRRLVTAEASKSTVPKDRRCSQGGSTAGGCRPSVRQVCLRLQSRTLQLDLHSSHRFRRRAN